MNNTPSEEERATIRSTDSVSPVRVNDEHSTPSTPKRVVEQLQDALNSRDLEAMLTCFDPNYHSEQPVHPEREFHGKPHVRENWEAVFSEADDFQAEILRNRTDGDVVWTEWHWHGTRGDETTLEMRGVTITGIENGRIVWGRLYMEPVESTQDT